MKKDWYNETVLHFSITKIFKLLSQSAYLHYTCWLNLSILMSYG